MALSDSEIVERSGRFDADFYLRTYRDSIPASQSPLEHFLAVGQARGFLASRRFDPVVYKLRHPGRRPGSPLLECILAGDAGDYRDIASLFPDIDVKGIPTGIAYPRELQAQWAAHVGVVVENIDRPVRLPWAGRHYELRNPLPDVVLSRLASNQPFAYARLTHGLWDSLYIVQEVAGRVGNDPRGRTLTGDEIKAAATRLFAREYLNQGKDLEVENFGNEIEQDLLDNPRDADFWTAIAVRGLPTFDDGVYGLDRDGLNGRLALIARFLLPTDTLYDATLWKRWALSGDLARFAEAARRHPVVLVGPGKFHTLGQKWGLPDYRHVAIGPRLSQLIRHEILERTTASVLAASRPGGPKPIVLFQCGSLAYWLIRRLRSRCPDAFYLDIGQALDLWSWAPSVPWMRIYGDTLCAANPFVVRTEAAEQVASPEADKAAAQVADILKRDYLDTGLMALPPFHRVCELTGEFRKQGPRGWSAELRTELRQLTDDNDKPRDSPLILLEDGRPLGIGHDRHESILNEGGGRYSFWLDMVYFSTPDGSDPTHNGRRYTVGRIDPEADKEAEGLAPLLSLNAEFRQEGANGWYAVLPPAFEGSTDVPEAPERSQLLLLENGRPLGPGHAVHNTIRVEGSGTYSFWRGGLYFSTSDNSDPNRNGRAYSVALAEASPIARELVSLFGTSETGFINQYKVLLGPNASRPSPFRRVGRKFVIGFTARVGSTLLCQHLFRYGVFTAEFLNRTHIRAETYVSGVRDYATLFSRLVETHALNDAWGVKAHIDSLIPLFFIGEFPDHLRDWRFVYLTRNNMVRQAVSAVIANKTSSWASWQPRARQLSDEDYSRAEIARLLRNIREGQRLWEAFFTMFGIQPLRLTYEEITADPVGAADRVAQHCGLTLGGEQRVEAFKTAPVRNQSTQMNVAWEARFRDEDLS